MGNQIKQIETTSRRNFTKALITAAVAAPILGSMNACRKPCTCPEPQAGKPIKCQFVIEGLEPEPHEPPIVVTNGSLRIDLSREFIDEPIDRGAVARRWQYRLKSPEYYTQIIRVQVLTEKEKDILTNYYYLNSTEAYLGIWLQKNDKPAGQDPEWQPRTLTGEPQILFSFVRETQNYLALETDEKLRYSRFKRLRRYRYEHPGYSAQIRLAKWSLYYPDPAHVIEADGSKFEEDLTAASSTSDGFQLAITFDHMGRRR